MKRILLFWTILAIVLTVSAQERVTNNNSNDPAQRETHVTPAEALNVGYTFMRTGTSTRGDDTRSSDVSKQTMRLIYTGRTEDSTTHVVTDCYYVFALQPKGFVIVAADNRVEPILGYSYDNDFVVENMPAHVRGWLGHYEKEIEAVAKQNITPESETTTKWSRLRAGQSMSMRSGESVGPLLTTTWDQGQYYNSLCPEDANGPDGHVWTGCVATAIAQIINFWGYPSHGRGIHSYNSNYGTLTVNYDSANYDYANMPASLTSDNTAVQVNAVATLMRDCGFALNMDYSAYESGAYDEEVRAVLMNFFKYSPNMSLAEKPLFTDDEWETMLRNDLDAGTPIYYSGQGTGGHAFVCDGYTADGYFSFNFGWGGYFNGWYLTSEISPGDRDYNDYQCAIFGIVPDSTGNVILGQMTGTSTFTVDEPLEFYHLMGHNAYMGLTYNDPCNNTVAFVSKNHENQIVADIIEFEDQNLAIYDGDGTWLRSFYGGGDNDLSPVVSTQHALNLEYQGNFYYTGFKLIVSQDNGCRMVSNIVSSVDATTVHFMWTENGNATQWQIEYGEKGFAHGDGTMMTTSVNTVTIDSLTSFTEYDFYIRSVCGNNQYGLWNKVTLMIEAPYWQDVVTSQPEGYVLNEVTNTVEISTAEGFAWWARNGCVNDAYIISDLDLAAYKWRPADLWNNLYGQGHVISNVYINESTNDVGFFTSVHGVIDNVGLEGFHVTGRGYGTGSLCGTLWGTLRNCYIKNSIINGGDATGGLLSGNAFGTVINCFVNVQVSGARWVGLMCATSDGIERNCYASGTVRQRSYCYNGGVVSYSGGGEVSYCYSVKAPMGVIGFKGSTVINDTSTMIRTDSGWLLQTPAIFEEESESDLLTALNKYLIQHNDSLLLTWVADTNNTNDGLPIFGNHYVVSCPNVSQLSVQNIKVNNNTAVAVGWQNEEVSSQWIIKYRRHDLTDSTFTYVITSRNPDTLFGIPLGYVYDFSVRAVCDSDNLSGWSETKTLIVDLPYWTDVVTVQPAGFIEDNDGNIEISSAEGLAWLSVLVNGFHNQQAISFEGKMVTLTEDINLEGFRWYPIGRHTNISNNLGTVFSGVFDGQDHSVSNIYINDQLSDLGLFGLASNGRIANVYMDSGYVASIYTMVKDDPYSFVSSGIGGLVGRAAGEDIINCHSSVMVLGTNGVGSLCGVAWEGSSISNCFAMGSVFGRQGCGGLVGWCEDSEVRNCYATGNINTRPGGDPLRYHGGLVGYCQNASVFNSYSTGIVNVDLSNSQWIGKVIGCPYLQSHVHCIFGQDDINSDLELIGNYCEDITDTALFHHSDNSNALLTPVSISGVIHTDLLNVLNAWVSLQNNQNLKKWVLDSITGYPVLGDNYEPSCYNPVDLMVSQATVVGDTTIRTQLVWTQQGDPDHWEVLYVFARKSIDSGTIVTVTTNPCVLDDIITGYPLDFYVRAICGDGDTSHWCGPVTYIPDKLRWTEVVTSQPEGYQEDANGNIYISSAEGLAWLSSVSNGLNGVQYDQNRLYDKRIEITTDIDLSAYRWISIGKDWMHQLTQIIVEGNNHTISGLYCNELADYQGLFGFMWGGLSNLIVNQCVIYGENHAGGLVGEAHAEIINCSVSGNVYGIESVGGIVGKSGGSYISNCCFRGIASSRTDISKNNSQPYYNGGICGIPDGSTIINCYVVSEISDEFDWSGIITSTANCPEIVSNCYYKAYETTLPITQDCALISNNSSFSGSGTSWNLNTPPYVNGEFQLELVDALNAWVDANNSEGIYCHWAADTANINGGYPVFATIPCVTVTCSDTILACDSYMWHGDVYTTSSELVDFLLTSAGCDSVVTHYLIVNHPLHAAVSEIACESYTWNGTTYTTSGEYTFSHLDANGCTQVDTLHLTINNPVHTAVTEIACESYSWNGTTYTTSGEYTFSHLDANGCTQVDTLHLTINNPVHTALTEVACESYTWNGTTYTISGEYTFSHLDANGCTQVDTLHLTINKPVYTAVTEIACESYSWNGTTYTTSGDYTFSHLDANGCTQVDTLHLTINNPVHTAVTEVACESFTWNGTTYTVSGDYTFSHLDAHGCTQVDTLHLTINNPVHTALTEVACESYTWNGTTYTTSGEYTFSHLDVYGCTQVDTLHLTINNPVHESVAEIAYDTYAWNGVTYDTTGVYTYEHQDGNGCMQVDTLHLTVYYSSSSDIYATVCESYTWNEEVFTTNGEYERHFLDIHGADSAVTLHLTVNHGTYNATTETVCDSYEWNGALYTESGVYIHEYTNEAGCPSVDTLHLTVNYSTAGIDEQVACESYTWIDGVTYTESTVEPTFTLTNAAECDSVVTLHLTIHFAQSSEFTVTCPDSCYMWNNIDYCQSGDYTQTLQTIHGCDSVVTLHLTITVGINDHETVDFKVYPNPTNGMVNIECKMQNEGFTAAEIHVMDAYGKLVRTIIGTNNYSPLRTQIDISDLANGVYFVKLVADGKVVAVRKVVKN